MSDQWTTWASIALAQLLAESLDRKPDDIARVAAIIADAMDAEYWKRS